MRLFYLERLMASDDVKTLGSSKKPGGDNPHPTSATRARPKKRRPPRPLTRDNGLGKGRRTPAQLERQEQIYLMHLIDGKTQRAIAAEMKCSQWTVISDIRHEQARRSNEIADRREAETARAIAVYETIQREALQASRLCRTLLDERDGAKISDHYLSDALKARERQDKLLGIESATKVDLGLQVLLDALEPK